MFQRKKLHLAVLSAIAATTAPHASAELEEIVVTATKRAVPLQDAPVTIQAIGSKELEDQNIQEFADYVQYLPNVNAGGRGPGQNEIYIRGAAVDAINITVAESQGSAPNVALYLDEQPVTAGGRNLDVYISDMERIEVLPGPQGTLYGASSMAGTVRLITAKPVLDQFDASFNGSWSSTSGGEDSNSAEVMLNLPIIDGKMAVRVALYNDRQGGFIDNVAGEFQADNTINPTFPGDSVTYAEGTVFANGTVVGAGGLTVPVIKAVANNTALVEDDFNDAHYAGMRLGVNTFCLTTGDYSFSTRRNRSRPKAYSITTHCLMTCRCLDIPTTSWMMISIRLLGHSKALSAILTSSIPVPSSIAMLRQISTTRATQTSAPSFQATNASIWLAVSTMVSGLATTRTMILRLFIPLTPRLAVTPA